LARRFLELGGNELGHGEQLELGAPLLAELVDADPPAQESHRLQVTQPSAYRAVVAIAVLPALPPGDLPRGMQRRETGDELAHAGDHGPAMAPTGREPA
jgi:hypothetical protein